MNKKLAQTLLGISSFGLLLAGLIFVLIALLDNEETTLPLIAAVACLLLSNLFILVRQFQSKTN